MPVIAGKWQQHELWDGTYTFNDLLDMQEILMVENENKKRYQEYLDAKQQQGGV